MSQSPNEKAGREQNPLISVVIPAYNAGEYIARTLESIFAQTFRDFEVLLINDGSPDSDLMEQQIRPYLVTIRYLRQVNQGPSAARNHGIREARGKFVAFLDADDFWFPDHLKKQVERMTKNENLGLVYANTTQFRGDVPVGDAFDRVPQSGTPDLDHLLSEQCTINTSSVVVRREALLRAGLFDEAMRHCEDFDLWLRVAALPVGMEYDRDPQIGHRIANGLAADSDLMKRGRMRAYSKFLERAAVTPSRREIVCGKLTSLEFELHRDAAKRLLLAGSYAQAASEIQGAKALQAGMKLSLFEIWLRHFPSSLRWFYSKYIRWLIRHKRSRELSRGLARRTLPTSMA